MITGKKINAILRITAIILALPVFNAIGMKPVQREQPLPLVNLGATCYMNSSLQLMASLKGLNQDILAGAHLYEPGSIGQSYANFIRMEYKGVAETPTICSISPGRFGLTFDQQDDPHEYLLSLWRELTENSFKSKTDRRSLALRSALNKLTHPETTEIIRGTNPESHRYEILSKNIPESSLFLELAIPANANTLEDCITHFSAPEALLGDEAYKVEGKIVKDGERTITLTSLPRYLFINLKRLVPITNEHGKVILGKDDRPILKRVTNPLLFPIEDYKINTSTGKDTYNLVGFAAHGGSARGGHWIAYIKHGNQWFRCSDKLCTRVSQKEIEEILQPDEKTVKQKRAATRDTEEFLPALFVYEKVEGATAEPAIAEPKEKEAAIKSIPATAKEETEAKGKKKRIGRKERFEAAEQVSNFALGQLQVAAAELQRKSAPLVALQKRANVQTEKRKIAEAAYEKAKDEVETMAAHASQSLALLYAHEKGTVGYREQQRESDHAQAALAEAEEQVRLTKRQFSREDSNLMDIAEEISSLENNADLIAARNQLKLLQEQYKNAALVARSLRPRTIKKSEQKK
jgi:hypothetical protein